MERVWLERTGDEFEAHLQIALLLVDLAQAQHATQHV
jgi:hypothetical protein